MGLASRKLNLLIRHRHRSTLATGSLSISIWPIICKVFLWEFLPFLSARLADAAATARRAGRASVSTSFPPARPPRVRGHGRLVGGQAEYVMVPYADCQPAEVRTRPRPWPRSRTYATLRHRPHWGTRRGQRGLWTGHIVYVAGAGPVGLACAAACHLLGAAVVIVGDMIPERLARQEASGLRDH